MALDTVTYSGIANGINRMQGAIADEQTNITQAHTDGTSIPWQGDAAQRFFAAMSDWEQVGRRLTQEMNTMAEKVQTQLGTYKTTESTNVGSVGHLTPMNLHGH